MPTSRVVISVSVELSAHARSRWATRSALPWLDPTLAWAAAVKLPESAFDAEEVRYHRRSETLLVRRDTTIVTVVDATDVRPATRDGLAALRKEASL